MLTVTEDNAKWKLYVRGERIIVYLNERLVLTTDVLDYALAYIQKYHRPVTLKEFRFQRNCGVCGKAVAEKKDGKLRRHHLKNLPDCTGE